MVRIKKMRNKFLPSIVLVTAILVCFASVQSFFSKSTAQRLQFHKIVETDASGCVKVNFDQRPVSKALFGSATASMTAPYRTNAFMDNEVMISLDLLSKKAIENLRGINFKSTEVLSKKAVEKLRGINLKSTEVLSKKAIEKIRGINLKSTEVFFTTCRDEMSREIAILFYAPLKRKLIFLVHPLIALFIVYFLSKFFAMLFVAAKGVGSTSIAVASDFSPSIADGQRKGSAKSMALRMKSEDASAVEAVATSLESKEENDRIAANEKVKKMAIEKALKEEEERERSASVQAKMEEQAARDIEENDRKVEAQRLAVEQATLRQLEEVRIERENKQRQEKELEARLADLQVKKEEQAIKAAQQKAAREEAAKVAELALQAKKEKQLKEQMEKKALEEEAAIVAAAALKEKKEEQLKAQKKAKEVKEDEDRLGIVDKLAEIANKEREAEDARLKIIVEAKEKAAFDSIKMSEIEEVMAWEKAQKKAEGDAWASRPEQEKRILEEREAMREAEAMRPEGDSGAASKADSSIRDLDPGMPWKGFEKADADSQAALKAEEDLTEMALKFTAEMKEKEEVKEKEVNEAIERAKKIEDEETAKAMTAAKKATEIAEAARAEAQALQKTVSIPVQMDAQKDANVPMQTDASVPVQKTVSIPVQMDAQKDANVKKSSFATKTADENSFMPPALFQKNKEAAQPAAGKKQPVVSKMKLITPPVTPSSSAGGLRKKEEPKVMETKVSSEEKVAVGAVDAVTASVDVNEENDRIAARELAVEKALKVYEEKEAAIARKLEIEAKVAREAKEKLALEASNLAKLKENEEAEAVTRAKENAAKKAELMAQIYAKEEEMSRALAVKLKDAMAKDASTRTEVKEMQAAFSWKDDEEDVEKDEGAVDNIEDTEEFPILSMEDAIAKAIEKIEKNDAKKAASSGSASANVSPSAAQPAASKEQAIKTAPVSAVAVEEQVVAASVSAPVPAAVGSVAPVAVPVQEAQQSSIQKVLDAVVAAASEPEVTDGEILDFEDDDATRGAAAITAAVLGFKVGGPVGAWAAATFANHYVNKDNLNGQVVRTIGKTAVGSVNLIKSVDSKFEIVRNVREKLTEAVKGSPKKPINNNAEEEEEEEKK